MKLMGKLVPQAMIYADRCVRMISGKGKKLHVVILLKY